MSSEILRSLYNKGIVKRVTVFAFSVFLFSTTTSVLAAEYWCSPSDDGDATCPGNGSCELQCGFVNSDPLGQPTCPMGQKCLCDPNLNFGQGKCRCYSCTEEDHSVCDQKYSDFYGVANPSYCPTPTCIESYGSQGACRINCLADETYDAYRTCQDWGSKCCYNLNSPPPPCMPVCQHSCLVDADLNDPGQNCPSGYVAVGYQNNPSPCCNLSQACCKPVHSCPVDSCYDLQCPDNYNQTTDSCVDPGKVCCTEARIIRPRPFGLLYTGPVIKNLQDILGPVAKMLYYGGLAIGVFFIILSGYRLMTSEGDPQKTKAAQEQLTSAIIGIIFILLSVTILRVIINQIIIIGEGI